LKFIHVTDFHLAKPGEKLWGLDPAARLEACLADIEAYHSDAEFIAITGDLTDLGEVEAYRWLSERLAALPIPSHLMIGNHDDRTVFHSVFGEIKDRHGFAQTRLEKDGAVFLFLDTLKGGTSSAGLYCGARHDWLAGELAAAKGKPVYLFMHHPPFRIVHPLMDRIMLEEPEKFEATISGHDIRHIFFGHAHRTISGTWHSIGYSALPGINHQLPLVAKSVPTVYSTEPAMYSVVYLEDGHVIVHSDAFLDRKPAEMPVNAEREGWL
jgi:3',5'-cyclic AMP phosphodiesterase CpdA